MLSFMAAAAIAFGAIFLAEFGDKSQLLIPAFATRYAARPVVLGLIIAAAIIQGASVVVGMIVGANLPTSAWPSCRHCLSGSCGVDPSWRGRRGRERRTAKAGGGRPLMGIGLVMTVTGTFFLGELGDKTMLATFALAATQGALPTWIGSTAGEVAANLVAVVVGRQIGHRLSPGMVRIGSASLFALAGVGVLASVALS